MRKIKPYLHLMRLEKPVGFFLLLWPTLWGLWLASAGKPNGMIAIVFILGVFLTRSAGCVINDLVDRHVDHQVERTRHRPLATKQVTAKEALALFFLLSLCACSLLIWLNNFTRMLALIGILLMLGYPFLKRVTYLPQLGLGVAFAWGIPMVFAAERNAIPISAWLLFFAAVLWPVIYDTMYAMVDMRDDVRAGIKSTAILFGKKTVLILALLQFIFLLILVWVGYRFHLSTLYYVGLGGAFILFGYQLYLIKDYEPKKCFQAFLNNQWVGAIIFIGIGASYLC